MKHLRVIALAGVAAAALAPTANAAPVVTEATGAAAPAIQPALDQFSNALGAPNGGNPPAPGGRRTIVWDGVPDGRAAPSFMPEGQFRNVGALFSTPGLGFEVSGDNDVPADPDPDQTDFTDVNPLYAADFAAFSPQRLFAPIASNVTDTTFVIPGTDTPAQTSGFGVVFSDVDVAGPSTIELFTATGQSLGTWTVPATAGSETFSFLGVSFDAGERAARARITTGAAPLGSPDVSQGGVADVVVMDNFVYGEPQAIPPDQGPQVQIKGAKKKVELSKLLRGFKLRLTPDEAASFEVSLLGSARSLELRKNDVILAQKELARAAGERQLKLKPKPKLLKDTPSRFKVQLRVEATDGAGNSTTTKKKIKVSA